MGLSGGVSERSLSAKEFKKGESKEMVSAEASGYAFWKSGKRLQAWSIRLWIRQYTTYTITNPNSTQLAHSRDEGTADVLVVAFKSSFCLDSHSIQRYSKVAWYTEKQIAKKLSPFRYIYS